METDPNEIQVEEPGEEGHEAEEPADEDFEHADEESAGSAEAPTGP